MNLIAVAVLITTSMGDIKVELDQKDAPVTVANFLRYVRDHHYDGTIFHRVIQRFMIQGGGYDRRLRLQKGAKFPPIKNESGNGLKNAAGTIAMARTSDPDSATDQFYINTHDNDFLDNPPGYAVFGKVVKGMSVVRKIEAVKTETKAQHDGVPMRDVPAKPVVIRRIRIVK
jgi:cyclophilin family peptidyl-prolyl cis-trans isomerase